MQIVLRDGKILGGGERPYIVAEVNSSHGGSMEMAKKMIEAAAECGCDCVKFQSWSAESLYSAAYYAENPIAKRIVRKFSLNAEQLIELAAYCRQCGVAFSSTPYSRSEVDFLAEEVGAPFIKVASMDLNNCPFLDYIARKGIPIVLSTGMGEMREIERAVETVSRAGNPNLCLLHCVSIYPTEPEMMNLNNISGLRQMFPDCSIGFSDHSMGTEMAAAAVALGACLIEKHLTLDRTKIGMDNQMAAEPAELKALVAQCNRVYEALGSSTRVLQNAEMEQRKKMRRSIVYARDLESGDVIHEADLDAKRPGTGVPPENMVQFIGKKLHRPVTEDTLLSETDFI